MIERPQLYQIPSRVGFRSRPRLLQRRSTPHIRSFRPRWKPELHGYSVRVVRGFYGTLSRQFEFDDLMQEAFIVYLLCTRRYIHVDNQRWFMAIYKRSLYNRMCNLCRALEDVHLELDEVIDPGDRACLCFVDYATELFEVLDAMPVELRMVALDLARPVARLVKSRVQRSVASCELKRYLTAQISAEA